MKCYVLSYQNERPPLEGSNLLQANLIRKDMSCSQLTEKPQRCVETSALDETLRLENVVRKFLWRSSYGVGMLLPLRQIFRAQCAIMAAHLLQFLFHPTPILKHDAGRLCEAGRSSMPMKLDVRRLDNKSWIP